MNGDIIVVTKVRCSGKGHFTTLHNHTVYYSGSEKGGNAGVAFILKPSIYKAALGYNPVNERLLPIRLQCKPFPLTIIANYSPTNDATDEEIEEHYSKLQALIDKKQNKDILVILGDFNAKVGAKTVNTEVMGSKGLGLLNEKGSRLVEFCQENHLCIMNTV